MNVQSQEGHADFQRRVRVPDVWLLAMRMLAQNRARLAISVGGVAAAFFLSAAQIGLMVGWINTITSLVSHANADLWVVAEQTPAFDYGTAIPRERLYQARSIPGVEWAEGLFMAWNIWQRPDGRRVNVELVGLDLSGAGGPWAMREGSITELRQNGRVIVDELYLRSLGVTAVGDNVGIINQRAQVVGISRGVRTFTASPFVFTSIEQAIRYDRRYGDDEITYVLARCSKGQIVPEVQEEMRRRLPHVEVLTTREFELRSSQYWMLDTGLGLTVVVTAILGFGVGVMIISQTLFAVTNENLVHHATLLALGFSEKSLVACVVLQATALGFAGILLGSVLFAGAALMTSRTAIPIETTAFIFSGLVLIALSTCAGASCLAVRAVLRVDPVAVFSR